jgi:hypothetical protein
MYITYKQGVRLIFFQSKGKQCTTLLLPTNITTEFFSHHMYPILQHTFKYHVRKKLQVPFYKNMFHLSPLLYQGWRISTIRSEKKDSVHVLMTKERKKNSLLEQNSITWSWVQSSQFPYLESWRVELKCVNMWHRRVCHF